MDNMPCTAFFIILKGYWWQFWWLMLLHSLLPLLNRITWPKNKRPVTRGTYYNLISFIAPDKQHSGQRAAHGHQCDIPLWQAKEGDAAEYLHRLAQTQGVTPHARLGERRRSTGNVYELMHTAKATGVTTCQNSTISENASFACGKWADNIA